MANFITRFTATVGFFAVILIVGTQGAVRLDGYNVDPSSVTVSGLSAGGAFATQFHIAFSNEVFGAGVFAGLPYTCGKGGLADASQCMSIPDFFAPIANLIANAEGLSSQGVIDPVSNLRGQKAYVFHGTADYTVNKGNGVKVQQMYEHFGSSVSTKLEMNANHGHPTDFYGAACSASSAATQYINNCDYNGAHEMFKHMYGADLNDPDTSSTPAGELLEFDQSEFTSGNPDAISLDDIGFVYIPSGCKDKTRRCRVHIAFHGCVQSRTTAGIGDAYATKTGYTHSAEVNNIIVIFPQAKAKSMVNPNSCFDWWGYLNANFLTKAGAQMTAVQNMLHRVLDCPTCQSTTTQTTTTTTENPNPSSEAPSPGCEPTEVIFKPFPGTCEYYTMCACGGSDILFKCAPGLYFDPILGKCNFPQLVPCEDDK
jgi:poly(3-hydroxybutyrate) depolymerase